MAMVPGPAYSEGFFGCFNDIPGCFYGLCCTYCAMGQQVENAKLEPCFNACCCLYMWNFIPFIGPCMACMKFTEAANKVEKQFGIGEEHQTSCPVICCLAQCATCRLMRETDKRVAAGIMPTEGGGVMSAPTGQAMQMQPMPPKV